ncbi:MAG: guanylate kinase [Pseudorhodoplanes sp.]
MITDIEIARRGIMLIVSSPSGAGKTTLTRNLLTEENKDKKDSVTLSVSVTTRERRTSEIDGVHYKFLTRREFELMRDGGELLEWAEVHGNFYGTPRGPVETALSEGRDVLFDIDWQGTQQLYKTMRSDVVSVFVLPPTAEELKFRLERRAEDTPEIIERRLKNAADEIPHWDEYDYVLVNRDVQKSLARLRGILTAERLKRVRKEIIQEFVDELQADLGSLSK